MTEKKERKNDNTKLKSIKRKLNGKGVMYDVIIINIGVLWK